MLRYKNKIEKPNAWAMHVLSIEAGNVEASIAEEKHEEMKEFDLDAIAKSF